MLTSSTHPALLAATSSAPPAVMRPEAVPEPASAADRSTRLGVALTLALMAVYFGFIGLGAFAPKVLAQPVVAGGVTTVAFAYGLFVIALGVVLTSVYVGLTNRRSS